MTTSVVRPSSYSITRRASRRGSAFHGGWCQRQTLGLVMPKKPRPSSAPTTLSPGRSRSVTSWVDVQDGVVVVGEAGVEDGVSSRADRSAAGRRTRGRSHRAGPARRSRRAVKRPAQEGSAVGRAADPARGAEALVEEAGLEPLGRGPTAFAVETVPEPHGPVVPSAWRQRRAVVLDAEGPRRAHFARVPDVGALRRQQLRRGGDEDLVRRLGRAVPGSRGDPPNRGRRTSVPSGRTAYSVLSVRRSADHQASNRPAARASGGSSGSCSAPRGP